MDDLNKRSRRLPWSKILAEILFTARNMVFGSGELRVTADKLQQLLNELQQQGAVVSSDLKDALAVQSGGQAFSEMEHAVLFARADLDMSGSIDLN